jgi:hypothetical protein
MKGVNIFVAEFSTMKIKHSFSSGKAEASYREEKSELFPT